MAPEQQTSSVDLEDVIANAETVTVVLWDETVETVSAGSAASNDGLLILFAGGSSVSLSDDVMVAQYAPGSWRSWYVGTDGDVIDQAMDARHPLRAFRWALGSWIDRRLFRSRDEA